MVSKGGVSPARFFLHSFWTMKTLLNSGWQVSSASLFIEKNWSCKSKPPLTKVSALQLKSYLLLCSSTFVSLSKSRYHSHPTSCIFPGSTFPTSLLLSALCPHIQPESFCPAWPPSLPGAAEQSVSWDLAPHSSRLLFNFYLPPPSSWINAKGNVRFGSQVSPKKSYSQSAGGGTKPAY